MHVRVTVIMVILLLQDPTSSFPPKDSDLGESCWHWFQTCLNRTILEVVQFAKKLPGFAALDQDDQISLIKGGCFEVSIIYWFDA